MKILIVCQHFYPEQFRINDIASEFVKLGNKATVLTGLPNYPSGKILNEYRFLKKRKETYKGVEIIRVSLIGRGDNILTMALNYLSFAINSSLKILFLRKDFDVIYVYQLSPVTMALPGIIYKKITGKKLIIHCLDQWPISITIGGIKKNSIVYAIFLLISKWIYSKADIITVSSLPFKKYFNEELKINDLPILYWPSYAEDNYINVNHEDNSCFDILFAGNIGPAQSVETIIESANILKHNSNIKFHIIGDGLNKDNCQKLVRSYNLKNVYFHGHRKVEDLNQFYDVADAFIITMVDNEVVNNTLPAKLQSYMAAGKPIIGSINGEVKRIVEEAKCGVVCKSGDYEALANIILEMEQNKNNLATMSANARNYYFANFEKTRLIKELEKIFILLNNEKK